MMKLELTKGHFMFEIHNERIFSYLENRVYFSIKKI